MAEHVFENQLEAFDGSESEVEIDGFTITARIQADQDHGPPWEEEDGHGPVSDWRSRESKRPGERVLCSDNSMRRYYDFEEAVKIACRDGWDAPPYGEGTAGERAHRAATADFEQMRRWCDNQWRYWGVVLSVSKKGIVLDSHAASLWGIGVDGDDSYLTECANEMIDEALEAGKTALASLVAKEVIS
jgi:hypothetical protein